MALFFRQVRDIDVEDVSMLFVRLCKWFSASWNSFCELFWRLVALNLVVACLSLAWESLCMHEKNLGWPFWASGGVLSLSWVGNAPRDTVWVCVAHRPLTTYLVQNFVVTRWGEDIKALDRGCQPLLDNWCRPDVILSVWRFVARTWLSKSLFFFGEFSSSDQQLQQLQKAWVPFIRRE